MFMQILKVVVGIATILTGVVSLFWPLKVSGFTGLEPNGGRGISEIRTILGALFIGLGAAVLYYRTPEVYAVLGISYLAMAVVRGISIIVDKSAISSNIISFVVEFIFGLLLVL